MGTSKRTYARRMVYLLALFALGMTIFGAVASREYHSTADARNDALSRLVALEAADLRHSDPSLAMQLSLVAYDLSATPEATASLIDTTAGQMPTRLLGPDGHTAMALGDDGHRVAIVYRASNQLRLYSLRYTQLRRLATVQAGPGAAKVQSVAISDSGTLMATGGSDGTVTLWQVRSPAHPQHLATLSAGAGAVTSLSFSPGATALAAADADGSVQRWSLSDAAHPATAGLLTAPGRPLLNAVSYSHDGQTLAAAARNGTLVIWRAHAGTAPVATLATGGSSLNAVAYSPDGRTLAAGGQDGAIHMWTLAHDGRPIADRGTLHGTPAVSALVFSRDGRYLAAASSGNQTEVWASAHWTIVATLPHPAAVTGVAFTDADLHLLSSDGGGTARVWPFPTPGTFTTGFRVRALEYSLLRPRLAVSGVTTGGAPAIANWDVADEWRPAPVGTWDAAPDSAATTAPYAPATTTATTPTTTTTAAVISPHAGHRALRETEAETTVLDYALSPNGLLFAAAGTDDRIWLWDVTEPSHPKLLAKLGGFRRWATSVVFSNSSQTLFAGSADHTIRLWDVSDPTAPTELADSPLLGPGSSVNQLALSPDGSALAAATSDGHVWLWGVVAANKASLKANLTAATGRPVVIAFSPTDNVLVAGGADQRLIFWHYRPYQAVNRICAHAGTPITAAEWERYVPDTSYSPPCATWTPPPPPQAAEGQ